MSNINIYCDESNHLEADNVPYMVLGAVYAPLEKIKIINTRIAEIKKKHGIAFSNEIKWVKVAKGKLDFYMDIVDYFFDNDDLHFRCIVIDKTTLTHDQVNTHDQFYYKMYFGLLSKILDPQDKYNIYLDIKDTQGAKKVKKLREVLCNKMYDFDGKIIERIQQVRSHEVGILQLADLLIGAIQFSNRQDVKSEAKRTLIERIRERSGYNLLKSTLLMEEKTNIFYWRKNDNL